MENYSLDIQFQEAYKSLDALCKDCYSNEKGISEYIRLMEAVPFCASRNIPSWEYDLKMLKHARYIRNELAHEVGTWGSGLCKEMDLEFMLQFHDKMLNCTDPLSVVRKFQTQPRPHRIADSAISTNQKDKKSSTATKKYESENRPSSTKPDASAKPSLWKRFIRTIKTIFRR